MAFCGRRGFDGRLGPLVPRRRAGESLWIDEAAARGITLGQLRLLGERAAQLCISEEWRGANGRRLNPEELTTADLVRWLLRPATERHGRSFVELIALRPVRAEWLVCAHWGQPWAETLCAIEQHAHDRQLHPATGFFFRAVCLSLHARHPPALGGGEHYAPPVELALRALLPGLVGTLCVTDPSGLALSSAWSCYELHAVLLRAQPGHALDLYTVAAQSSDQPQPHNTARRPSTRGRDGGSESHGAHAAAVGLLEGEAPVDALGGAHAAAGAREARESRFPMGALPGAALRLALEQLDCAPEEHLAYELEYVRSSLGPDGLSTVRAALLARLLANGAAALPAAEVAPAGGGRWLPGAAGGEGALLERLGLGWARRCLGGSAGGGAAGRARARLRFLAPALRGSQLRRLLALRARPDAREAHALGCALPPSLQQLQLSAVHPRVLGGVERLLRLRPRAGAEATPAAGSNGNGGLRALELAECGVGGARARSLARALGAGGAPLESLCLRRNALGDEGAAELARALLSVGGRSLLALLDLSSSGIGERGGVALAGLLRSGSGALPRLRLLDLSDNALGKRAGAALGEALGANEPLRALRLGWNRLSNGGAAALAAGLERRIEWRERPFPSEGGSGDGDAGSGGPALDELNLTANAVGDAGATALAAALAGGARVHKLVLQRNVIGDSGGCALGAALARGGPLRALSLWSNYVGDEGARALAACLRTNSALNELNLLSNAVSAAGLRALGAAWSRSGRSPRRGALLSIGEAPTLDAELAEHFPRSSVF